MKRNQFIRCILLVYCLFLLAACSSPTRAGTVQFPPSDQVGTIVAATLQALTLTTPPTATSPPTGVMPILTIVEYGFRFRYPPEYQVAIHPNMMCLALEQGYGPPGLCHMANLSIAFGEANGRSLDKWANDAMVGTNPDIPVKRTSLTISGEEAILLDDINTVDVVRYVMIMHDDRIYRLTFIPWKNTLEGFPCLEFLYNTIINSFEFLPSRQGSIRNRFPDQGLPDHPAFD